MTKLRDMDISPVQLIVGLCFTVVGFTVYYFVPLSIVFKQFGMFFFVLLSVLFGMIIGMILIGSLLVPYLEQLVLSLIIYLRGSRDSGLKPIIKKNLNSHAARNHKTSLMFMIAVTFLIFCGSSFAQVEYLILSLTSAIVNADVALFIANPIKGSVPIALDEARISEYLTQEMQREDGIVKGFNYIGWTLNEVFTTEAKEG